MQMNSSPKLDGDCYKILDVLRSCNTISVRDLATVTKIGFMSVERRLARMQALGVIRAIRPHARSVTTYLVNPVTEKAPATDPKPTFEPAACNAQPAPVTAPVTLPNYCFTNVNPSISYIRYQCFRMSHSQTLVCRVATGREGLGNISKGDLQSMLDPEKFFGVTIPLPVKPDPKPTQRPAPKPKPKKAAWSPSAVRVRSVIHRFPYADEPDPGEVERAFHEFMEKFPSRGPGQPKNEATAWVAFCWAVYGTQRLPVDKIMEALDHWISVESQSPRCPFGTVYTITPRTFLHDRVERVIASLERRGESYQFTEEDLQRMAEAGLEP